MMTPKQHQILFIVRRYCGEEGMTALDIGIAAGQPRKKSEKWAKPGLKELIKEKLVERKDGKFYTT